MTNGDQQDKLCNARHETLHVRLAAMDKALELNAKNVETRLETLNALRADVMKDRSMFVRGDMYEAKHAEVERWIKSVDDSVNRVERRVTIVETKIISIAAAIIFIGSVIQLILHFWKR